MTKSDANSARVPAPAKSMTDDFDRAADALLREKPPRHPTLRAAAGLIEGKQFAPAANLLRDFMRAHPDDAKALYMAAEAAAGLGRHKAAHDMLAKCVEIAPE